MAALTVEGLQCAAAREGEPAACARREGRRRGARFLLAGRHLGWAPSLRGPCVDQPWTLLRGSALGSKHTGAAAPWEASGEGTENDTCDPPPPHRVSQFPYVHVGWYVVLQMGKSDDGCWVPQRSRRGVVSRADLRAEREQSKQCVRLSTGSGQPPAEHLQTPDSLSHPSNAEKPSKAFQEREELGAFDQAVRGRLGTCNTETLPRERLGWTDGAYPVLRTRSFVGRVTW